MQRGTLITRRALLAGAATAGGVRDYGAARPADLIRSLDVTVLHRGRDGGKNWFLPRFCVLPDGRVFLSKQEISGSDYYGPLHWQESRDRGLTWSEALPVPGLGRRPFPSAGAGTEEAASDFTPEYHAKTRSLILLGEIIYYRDGKYFPEQPQRFPVYVVRDAKGNWSDRRRLEWDDPRTTAIYAIGSAQFVILPSGDLLVPVSFRPKERAAFSVSTLQCSFDGRTMKVRTAGNELRNDVKRGLLEPQLIAYGGRYWLTIRAEDERGYWSGSDDGLRWSDPQPWSWDDGEPLVMSTTQQHWLVHSDALYLVYTRKAEANRNVMRWRAPLYLAEVDRRRMRLIRASERVVFPLIGDGIGDPTNVAHYGNFHVGPIDAAESWITCGEVIPSSFRGDMLLARVKWGKPNRKTR